MTPELQAKIALWRQKAAENTLSLDEMKEAILAIRGDRRAAAESSEKSRTRKASAVVSQEVAGSMLNELKGL